MRGPSIGLVAMFAFAGPAFAQQGGDWSGVSIALAAAPMQLQDASSASTLLAIPLPAVFVGDSGTEAVAIGAGIAYRLQAGGLVYGVEADLDWTGAGFERRDTTASLAIDANWMGSLRAVAGLPAGPTFLFATAGIAMGDVDFAYGLGSGAPQAVSEQLSGWTGGVGIEWSFGAPRLRLEYRRTEFDTVSHSVLGFTFTHDLAADSLRLTAALPLG